MLYLDTSLLVAALTRERHTAGAQRWLSTQAPGELAISDWTTAEFSAALSMKVRTRALEPAMRADVLTMFRRLVRDSLVVLPVERDDFLEAARLADRHESSLRAGGALHLGVAANRGCRLISLDRVQVQAAAAAGIGARLL